MKNMLFGTFIPSIMKDIYFSMGNAVGNCGFRGNEGCTIFYAFVSVTFCPCSISSRHASGISVSTALRESGYSIQ